MYAAWQLDLQSNNNAGGGSVGQYTVARVRSAYGQFGSQFAETLADVTDGSATWEMLGDPTIQQSDVVVIECGVAKKSQ